MPTQSDSTAPLTARSVFPNFNVSAEEVEPAQSPETPLRGESHETGSGLQAQIDRVLARCFVYRFLAAAFEYPSDETWSWLTAPETQLALQASLSDLKVDPASGFCGNGMLAIAQLREDRLNDFIDAYLFAFGHAARGPCPINEIEYGDLKADPLFQPHRLADLAAFYRAFGLELSDDAGERHDHLSIELEFMSVLAAKEAFALEHQLDDELRLCRDAQGKFLREHLGRWVPACIWRLCRSLPDSPLTSIALFAREFVAAECSRFGITPGSEDLMLRPVDEAGESLCTSCGITNLPPGALTAT